MIVLSVIVGALGMLSIGECILSFGKNVVPLFLFATALVSLAALQTYLLADAAEIKAR